MDETELSITKSDYYSALADFGISHDLARVQTEDHSDLIEDPIAGLTVRKSEIDGEGVFADVEFSAGDVICIARAGNSRTLAGRYANHSPKKNGVFVFSGDNINLVAVKDIATGDEITVDYRDALSLRICKDDLPVSVYEGNSLCLSDRNRMMLTGLAASAYDLLLSKDHTANLTVRERVLAFEHELAKLPQAEIEPKHEFIDGLYRREITFQKGTFATGKIHKDDHMDVVLSGEMVVASEDGYKYIKGPCTLTSRAGNKKAGYALTDVTWVTYHPTKETTVEGVESEMFLDDFEEIPTTFSAVGD